MERQMHVESLLGMCPNCRAAQFVEALA